MTEYVILANDEDAERDVAAWVETGDTVSAGSIYEAVRKHASEAGVSEGVFLAIPKRSFKKVPVKVEVTKRVKVG